MVPQQKAFSLHFLSSIYSISVQNLHEVVNTPFPMSRRQLSNTGKLSREQAIASLSNSSSTNMAELKLQQGKKVKATELLNKHDADTHNLFWLRKPVASPLGWTPFCAFSSCQGTHMHGLESCFEFFNWALQETVEKWGDAQRVVNLHLKALYIE